MLNGLGALRSPTPFIVNKNAMAALTGWLSGDFWSNQINPVTTTWTALYAPVTTTWVLVPGS